MNDTRDNLQALYPFLHGDEKDSASENTVLLESVRQKSQHSLDEKQRFFADNSQALVDAARAIADVYRRRGRMFTQGNGGSSCDAAHFAVEFQHPVTAGRPALPAINLCVDTAMLSAVGNDVGIQHVFSRQLDAHARTEDGLVGFSTSGNSANVIAGFRKAKELGMTTIGFCGGDGGEMLSSGLVDHCLVVETDSIHRVQEVHVACYHIVWDLVHTLLADYRGKLGADSGSVCAAPHPNPSPRGRGAFEGNTQHREDSSLSSPLPHKSTLGEGSGVRGGVLPNQNTQTQHARNLRQTSTNAEQHLWYRLRDRRLDNLKFRRQHPIGPYFADFACLQPKLVIELDGGQHQEQAEADARRTANIEQQGFHVLRFWNNQVFGETDAVLETILKTAGRLKQP